MIKLATLVCKYEGCNLIYQNPVDLPCGRSLCRQHLDNFDDKFECYFCGKEHQIPEDGFLINKTMNEMIDNHFDLDPLRKRVKESFENLNESFKDYQDINSDSYIHSYFFEIRNKVDLHREELIAIIMRSYGRNFYE